MQTYYRVDRKFRIVDVGGDWDDFAIRNASDECVSKYVVGDDLFSHITGHDVRMWVESLITTARHTLKPIRVNYRCDGPQMRRRFRLCAEPEPDDVVMVSHELIAEEPQGTRIVLSPVSKGRVGTPRCSICNSVRLGGRWVDPFELGLSQEFQVRHEVCPRCQNNVADHKEA